MKTFGKFNSYALFAVLFSIFTFSNQVCSGQEEEEDTVFNSYGGFIKNMGQLLNTENEAATDVLYYAPAGNLSYYLLNNKIAYVFAQAIDTTDEDSLYRMDLIFDYSNETPGMLEPDQLYYNNYYLAHTGEEGISEVGVFESIVYYELMEDVNVKCSMINGLQLKFAITFDPEAITPVNPTFSFDGADSTVLSANNDTVQIYCPLGIVIFDSLYAYQIIDSEEERVECEFEVDENGKISFDFGHVDADYALFISIGTSPPTFGGVRPYWSTNIRGASFDQGMDVWIDDDQNIYYTGVTNSNAPDFPIFGGQWITNPLNDYDAFVIKFNHLTRYPDWGSFFGGTSFDYGFQVAVNSNGYVYIAGDAQSNDMPACTTCTPDPLLNNGTFNPTINNVLDIFIVKFAPDGKLNPSTNSNVFATYFGGGGFERVRSMTIDNNDNVYISGYVIFNSYSDWAADNHVPLSGAYDQQFGQSSDYYDGFILKINSSDEVKWCIAIGGNSGNNFNNYEMISDLITDDNNNLYATGLSLADGDPAYIATAPCTSYTSGYFPLVDPGTSSPYVEYNRGGYDAIIMKFNSNNALEWSTFFGGQNDENAHEITGLAFYTRSGIAIDSQEGIFITGSTKSSTYGSTDFPHFQLSGAYDQQYFNNDVTCTGISDAFIAKFGTDNDLLWSTYLGGCNNDYGCAIAISPYSANYPNTGVVYILGTTNSTVFPLYTRTHSYNQPAYGGGTFDSFIAEFSIGGGYHYGSWFGGNGTEIGRTIVTNYYGDLSFICGEVNNGTTFPFAKPDNYAYFPNTGLGTNDAFITNFLNYSDPARIGGEESVIISEVNQDNIYPNPASNYISISDNNLQKLRNIAIFNSLGASIKSFDKSENRIYIGNLPAGLYLVRWMDNDDKIQTSRFIVE